MKDAISGCLGLLVVLAVGYAGSFLFFHAMDRWFACNNADQSATEPPPITAVPPTKPTPPPISEPFPANVLSVYIPSDIMGSINNKFATTSVEFRYCLYGRSYADGLLVTSFVEATTYSASSTLVFANDCSSDSIGCIHSHPIGNCYLSSGDKSNLMTQGKPIQGTLCGVNRLAFFTPQSPDKTIRVYSVTTDSHNNVISKNEITLSDLCPIGDSFCNGECWKPCGPYQIFRCTPSGGRCEADPNNCPPGERLCNGRCWRECVYGRWTCTPTGAKCIQ